MKKLILFIALIVLTMSNTICASAQENGDYLIRADAIKKIVETLYLSRENTNFDFEYYYCQHENGYVHFTPDEKLEIYPILCEIYSSVENGYFNDINNGNNNATIYITLAKAMGIISGYGDQAFRPDQFITYNEALTMLVRAFDMRRNYEQYPKEYINAAAKIGITKDLIFEGTDNVTPENFHKMLSVAVTTANFTVQNFMTLFTPPKTPEECAELYAQALKDRNGVMQYALLSNEMREIRRQDFESRGWVSGTSSPWISDYKIAKTGDLEFTVHFQYATSTGPSGESTLTLPLENIDNSYRIKDDMLSKNDKNAPMEKKPLTLRGYTIPIDTFLENRTAFSENNVKLDTIIKSLQPMYEYNFKSYSLEFEPVKTINLYYQLDPENILDIKYNFTLFPDDAIYRNTLLLFASVKGLEKINVHEYDGASINITYSDTIEAFHYNYGNIDPLTLDYFDIYNALLNTTNLSEAYFSKPSRIYLGNASEHISYRNGDPDEIKAQSNGSTVWIYHNLGSGYSISPTGEKIVGFPGIRSLYYFDSPLAEENDNLTGLYATMFYETDGWEYDDIVNFLYEPTTIKDMEDGKKYIAYKLTDEQNRFAYFIFQEGKEIAHGIMYGDDYTILNFE